MNTVTTITMSVDHPSFPTKCAKGSEHEVVNSYSNGFDIRIEKEKKDYVYPYVLVFIPRTKCSVNQKTA